MRSEIVLRPAAPTPSPSLPRHDASLCLPAAGAAACPHSQHADRVQAVVEGRVPAEGALLDISTSWGRCLSRHRIDPAASAHAHVLTSTELKHHRGPLERMIRVAANELDRLHDVVGQERYIVLLCDPKGVAVDYRVNAADSDDFRGWGVHLGGLWSEEMEGTNAVGTSIAEKRAITVHRRQHFRARYTSLSCSCAPILDGEGRIVAVVNVTSLDPTISERAHALSGPLVSASARAIEKRLAENSAALLSPSGAHRGGLPPATLRRVRTHIESHLAERVSIEQLAAVAGLSVFHFARAFKQSEGITPHEYLVDRRVAHAHKLIEETDTPLSEIALVSGFADQSHLARQFKKRVGVSPRTFRQTQRCDRAASGRAA